MAKAEIAPSGPVAPPGSKLPPGLYFIATPIGQARDITLRALDLLQVADVLAAEDTRSLRHLMDIHGIARQGRPLVAYHDHNGAAVRPKLLAALAEGHSVLYASEAGTPLIADPGFQLAKAAAEAGFPVIAAPGPSAVLAALTLSGLPTDRFLFAGFPPAQAGARARFLAEIGAVPATLVLFESPRRLPALLAEMAAAFGGARQAAVCRELTKKFEEVRRGSLAELSAIFASPPKGEIVLVIDRPLAAAANTDTLDEALAAALANNSLKEAVAAVAAALSLPRKAVYARALALQKGAPDAP